MPGPTFQFQGRNFGIENAATWELEDGLNVAQNASINSKIDSDRENRMRHADLDALMNPFMDENAGLGDKK